MNKVLIQSNKKRFNIKIKNNILIFYLGLLTI